MEINVTSKWCDQLEEIVGFVFPIRSQHANSIFEKGKDVFFKFGGRLKRLQAGAKVIFHVSGEKLLIGEAIIKSIERMTPEEVWKKYGTRLFLTRAELLEYSRESPLGEERRKKELTVYVLTKVKKYKKPIFPKRRMTIAGYYITRNEYLDLQ